MRVIAELRPEFIKVDRSLIQAIESDRARRALVVALLSFSGHIGARLIAEGIETHARAGDAQPRWGCSSDRAGFSAGRS